MPCSTSDSGCLGTDTQYRGLERGTESFLLHSLVLGSIPCEVLHFLAYPMCAQD